MSLNQIQMLESFPLPCIFTVNSFKEGLGCGDYDGNAHRAELVYSIDEIQINLFPV